MGISFPFTDTGFRIGFWVRFNLKNPSKSGL